MKAKKVMALALTAAMTMGMATTAFAAEDNTHIYVLTASEDHGWTGSVATFAKEKVEEINGEGTYSAEVITAASASDQITQIEDILAGDTDNIAIVVQPLDDTLQLFQMLKVITAESVPEQQLTLLKKAYSQVMQCMYMKAILLLLLLFVTVVSQITLQAKLSLMERQLTRI